MHGLGRGADSIGRCEVSTDRERARALLDLRLGENNSGAATVRGYLIALLRRLWIEEDGFSGKRPFGSSGWPHNIYVPMVKAGIVPGTLDEDGYLNNPFDYETADRLILSAIDELGQTS